MRIKIGKNSISTSGVYSADEVIKIIQALKEEESAIQSDAVSPIDNVSVSVSDSNVSFALTEPQIEEPVEPEEEEKPVEIAVPATPKPRTNKIVLVTWEMLETGGIIRVISGYQTGFAKLGYEVSTFHANNTGRVRVSPDNYTFINKWYRPKSVNLGWDNQEHMMQFEQACKEADFVLSIHGCPHPTKTSAKGDYGWQKIYEIARKHAPVGIVITDNLWNRLYSWITDVIEDDTKVFYNNYNAKFDSIKQLNHEAIFVDYPIDFDERKQVDLTDKPIDVAWLPQWKKWKGIYEFLEQLSKDPNRFRTGLFNTGIEYYNIRNTDMWKNLIRRDNFTGVTHNKDSKVTYFGMVEPDQVGSIYAKSKVSIDLSGAYAKKFQSQFTCAMAESMMYGALLAVPPYIVDDEKSRINGLPIVYGIRKHDIVESLDEIIKNEPMRKVITTTAYEWVKENCSDDVASKTILNHMLN